MPQQQWRQAVGRSAGMFAPDREKTGQPGGQMNIRVGTPDGPSADQGPRPPFVEQLGNTWWVIAAPGAFNTVVGGSGGRSWAAARRAVRY